MTAGRRGGRDRLDLIGMNILEVFGFSGRDGDAAHALYVAAVSQARRPAFYTELGVPDTVDGRFDMIALMTYLILRRLKAEGEKARRLNQKLFDLMFADMDRNLREMGVGDLSVGRKVKELATLFYGRVSAYETGLAGDGDALDEALRRNLYRKSAPSGAELAAMAAYLRAEAARSESWTFVDLKAGRIEFGHPVAAAAESAADGSSHVSNS